jgi:hypothetical protein
VEDYRKNLVKKPQENPKKQKGTVLRNAKNTEEDIVSEKINIAKREAIKKFGLKNFEEENKRMDRAIKKFGFDIYDISNEIPKDINLLLEKSKVGLSSSKEEIDQINNFFDKISGGKYLSKKYLNHISRFDPHSFNLEKREENNADENFFGKNRSFTTPLVHDGFYFAVGENDFIDVNRPLMIFSKENPNFVAYLLSELMEYNNFISDETREFIGENYIYKKSCTFDDVVDVLKKDTEAKKIITNETNILEIDGKKVYHINDAGYHARYTPSIVAYLMLIDEQFELSSNQDGVMLNGGCELKSMKEHGLYNKRDEEFSFATISDTIIDLSSRRVYKFNKENFYKKPEDNLNQEENNLEVLDSFKFYDDNENYFKAIKKGLAKENLTGLNNTAFINFENKLALNHYFIGLHLSKDFITEQRPNKTLIYAFTDLEEIRKEHSEIDKFLEQENVYFVRLPATASEMVKKLQEK